jgi:ferredoxin-type protein NapG
MSENETDRKPVAGPTPPLSKAKKQTNRRRFLRTTLLTGGVLGAALSGFLPIIYSQKKRLRPPGALDEKDFLGSCIKCGQCVQVCPVQAIKLADLIDGMGVGTPYIDPRSQACDFSCDAVQCILACPTGSLVYHKPDFLPVRAGAALQAKPTLLAKEKDAEPTLNMNERIGVARLSRPEACLAIQGKGFKGQARGAEFKGSCVTWMSIAGSRSRSASIPTMFPNVISVFVPARSREPFRLKRSLPRMAANANHRLFMSPASAAACAR